MPLSRNRQGEICRRPFCLTASLIYLLCGCRRKRRGRRSRNHVSDQGHHSCRWDESPTHEPLLATPRTSLTSEESCQTIQGADFPAARCFVTPVKGYQNVNDAVDSPQNDPPSPVAARGPFRPLDATMNRSRPPFLSPLYSPKKPRHSRAAKPVRPMMDMFLDSRAKSGMDDDSDDEVDDEAFRGIGRRPRTSEHMRTPESPTPPSSRASSRGTDSILSTPTRTSNRSSPEMSPRRRPGFYLWAAREYQESPSKRTTSLGPSKPWRTLSTQRDGFWRREAERLRLCAPKILLPSWHLGRAGRGDGEDTERLMTLAEVSLADLELDISDLDLDLGPPGHRGFEVSEDRSTANWS